MHGKWFQALRGGLKIDATPCRGALVSRAGDLRLREVRLTLDTPSHEGTERPLPSLRTALSRVCASISVYQFAFYSQVI
jgi:hypothetical protein